MHNLIAPYISLNIFITFTFSMVVFCHKNTAQKRTSIVTSFRLHFKVCQTQMKNIRK